MIRFAHGSAYDTSSLGWSLRGVDLHNGGTSCSSGQPGAVSGSFRFTSTLVPTTPGQSRSVATAKFADGGGNSFAPGASFTQDAGAHLP